MNKSIKQVEYSKEFYERAELLSEYISDLKLTKGLNDKLVNLILDQIEIAEQEAFIHGFKIGIKYNVEQILENEEESLVDKVKKCKINLS